MFQQNLITDSNGNCFNTATGLLVTAGTGPICIAIDGKGNYYDTVAMKPLAVMPYNRWSTFVDGAEGQAVAFMVIILLALIIIAMIMYITKNV